MKDLANSFASAARTAISQDMVSLIALIASLKILVFLLQPYLVDCSSPRNLTQVYLKPPSLDLLVKEFNFETCFHNPSEKITQKQMVSTLDLASAENTLVSLISPFSTSVSSGESIINRRHTILHLSSKLYKSYSKLNHKCTDLS